MFGKWILLEADTKRSSNKKISRFVLSIKCALFHINITHSIFWLLAPFLTLIILSISIRPLPPSCLRFRFTVWLILALFFCLFISNQKQNEAKNAIGIDNKRTVVTGNYWFNFDNAQTKLRKYKNKIKTKMICLIQHAI